ncbi:glutaredoxin family protein [Ferrimonas gelatinilytica]|uniref:Glutaredoxin domain-containing protein n=1 Tax=Ferrimonas gelatinilytica TaxID=1255257 RepID=A0ABP9SCM2_9GAMM
MGAGARLAQSLHQRYDSPLLFYSASWCGVCDRTRSHLKSNGIPFVELDIEKDGAAAQQFAQFGGHGVPLLLVEGQVLRGFDPAWIARSLAEGESED